MAASPSSFLLTAAIALWTAAACPVAPAWSQSAPASGSGAISPPSAAALQNESIDSQIAAFADAPGEDGGGQSASDGSPGPAGPRQIHGQAGAAFGSNGYRAGYVETEIPVGTDSTLGVGVSDSQARYRGGPTVRAQSLDLSLMVGGQSTPRPCNAAQRSDGADPEPLWVSHLRDQPDGQAAGCNGPGSN